MLKVMSMCPLVLLLLFLFPKKSIVFFGISIFLFKKTYADLEAGTTYQIQAKYAGNTVSKTGLFQVEFIGEPAVVSGVNILAPDKIECEFSPYKSGFSLSANVLPVGSEGIISWEISDRSVIDFNEFEYGYMFVPKGVGTTTITATCNGFSDSVTIAVNEPKEFVLNQWENVTHDKGNSSHIFKFTPDKTGNYELVMDSGDTYDP